MAILSSGMLAAVSGAGGSGAATSGRTADNDNDFSTANSITTGTSVNGSVNATDDTYDYYMIDLVSGQTLKANLSYTNSTNTMVVDIYDQSQNFISEGYQGFPNIGTTILAVANGTYYIAVWIFLVGADDYTLNVTVGQPATLAPGNNISTYLNLTSAEVGNYYRIWLNGNISGRSEGAWINVTGDTPGSTAFVQFMDILNSANSETYNYSVGNGVSESVSLTATYTGWYYLYLAAYDGAATWSFTTTKFTAPSDGDNDFNNATMTKHNAVILGKTDQGWDHYDWYKYHVYTGDTCTIRVDRQSGSDLFNMSVYDPSFVLVGGAMNFDPQTGSITSALLNLPAADADTYYIVSVSAYIAYTNSPNPHALDTTAKIDYKLTFTSTNHRPSVQSSLPDAVMNEDSGYFFNLSSHYSDIDGDTIHFNFTGLANVAADYNEANGTLSLIPNANWFGNEKLTVQADDYFQDGSVMLKSNITVNSVNDMPYVKKSMTDVKMPQGGTDTSIDLSKIFADFDISPPGSDRLNYTVEDNGSVWVEIQANGAVRLTAPNTYYGSLTMNFIATDNDGATARAACNVTVTHVNQGPHIGVRPANISINEDETATIDLSQAFVDPETDPVAITASDMTRINVAIDPNTRIASLKPLKDMSGFYEDIKFTSQDDLGKEGDFVVIRVTVVAVNDRPVFKTVAPSGDLTLIELQTQEFSGSATDIDSSNLNYTWYLDGKDIHISETTYTYVTTYDSAGNHTVKLVVDDGELEISRVWNVTVINLNRPPSEVKIVTPKTGEAFAQAAEIEFEGSAKDLDKETITYTWMDGKTELSTERSFTTTTLKPGNHNIYLEASDGIDAVRSKNILITVLVNNAPTILGFTPASGQKFTTGQRIAFSVNVRNDEATDNLTFTWSENNGANVLSTSQSFETAALKAGMHTIIISVNDGFSVVNASVTVEVANPAPAPGMSTRTLGIMAGIVAAVAIIAALAFIMMRRRKPSASDSGAQAGQVAQPPVGATAPQAPAPYPQPYPSGYQPMPPPPPYDYSGGYQQPPQQYDPGPYQPPAPGEPGVPPADAYQQQPAWAMAPPAEPGGGDMVRPAEPALAPPPPEARPPTEPEQPQ